MPDLFLILHKVRGEPAFDVAYPFRFGDEEGWLIPTSGHRAHPAWSVPLKELSWNWRGNDGWSPTDDGFTYDDIADIPPLPEDLPDHYAASEPRVVNGKAAREPAFNPRGLLAELGLARKQTIKVRKIT